MKLDRLAKGRRHYRSPFDGGAIVWREKQATFEMVTNFTSLLVELNLNGRALEINEMCDN